MTHASNLAASIALLDEAELSLMNARRLLQRPDGPTYEELSVACKLRVSTQAAIAEAAVLMDRMKIDMIAGKLDALDGAIANILDLEGGPITRAQVEELDADDESIIAEEQAQAVRRNTAATRARMGQ